MKRKFYGMFIDNAVLYYALELAEQASAHEKCHPREKESVVSRISSRTNNHRRVVSRKSSF